MRKTIRIGDLCTVVSGTTPKTGNDEYWDGDILWVTPAELTEESFIINDTTRKITDKAIKESGLKSFPEGTVLLSSRAPIGKVAIAGKEMYCNQGFKNFICNDELNNEYLYWFLKGKNEYLNSLGRGATFKEISKSIVENIHIPLPGLDEQIHISSVLSKCQSVIKLRKEQIKQLDNLIKSRFVEMFGDPVENTMNWEMTQLGELSIQINSGNTPKGGEQVYVDEGIRFFRSQNVWKDRLEMENIAFIDKETHKNMKRSSLKHGDILMTKTGRINTENSSLGRAALYLGEDDAANVNGHVYFIRLKPGINNEFILKILVSKEYLKYIRSVCVGGIDKRQLNKNHIEEFPIICPPKDMQDKFIQFVQQVDKLKVEVQKSLNEIQILFDSLMQNYFE